MRIRAEDFEPLEAGHRQFLLDSLGTSPFSRLLGLAFEEIRRDYSRMRLPYREQLDQPMGMVHGGAIASLIDTVVVGAIFSGLEAPPKVVATIDLHVHYLSAVVGADVVAEAWVRRRGRSVIFLGVDARTEGGEAVAHGNLSYRIVV